MTYVAYQLGKNIKLLLKVYQPYSTENMTKFTELLVSDIIDYKGSGIKEFIKVKDGLYNLIVKVKNKLRKISLELSLFGRSYYQIVCNGVNSCFHLYNVIGYNENNANYLHDFSSDETAKLWFKFI